MGGESFNFESRGLMIVVMPPMVFTLRGVDLGDIALLRTSPCLRILFRRVSGLPRLRVCS